MAFRVRLEFRLVAASGVAADSDSCRLPCLPLGAFNGPHVDVDHAQRNGVDVEAGQPEELDLLGVSLKGPPHELLLDFRVDPHFEQRNVVRLLAIQGCFETFEVRLSVALRGQGLLHRLRNCHGRHPPSNLEQDPGRLLGLRPGTSLLAQKATEEVCKTAHWQSAPHPSGELGPLTRSMASKPCWWPS